MSALSLRPCSACNRHASLRVRSLHGSRSKQKIPLCFCLYCRSFSSHSQYREDDSQLSQDLQQHIDSHADGVSRATTIVEELRECHPTAKTLLDIGAGIGSFLLVAREAGLAVDGIEPNRYAVEYAEREFSLKIACAYFQNAGQQGYDLISLIHVLEHLNEPLAFLENVRDALNDDGVFYVSVPFHSQREYWRQIIRNKKDGPLRDPDRHVLHFSVAGAVALLERAGFSCVQKRLHPEWGAWSGGLICRKAA